MNEHGAPEHVLKKISPQSPDFRADVEMSKRVRDDMNEGVSMVFGEDDLLIFDHADNSYLGTAEEKEKIKHRAEERLRRDWRNISVIETKRDARRLFTFLSEIFQDDSVLQKVEKIEGMAAGISKAIKKEQIFFILSDPEKSRRYFTCRAFLDLLVNDPAFLKRVPLALLVEMTRRHVTVFDDEKELFVELLESTKTDIKNRLMEVVERGELPIDKARIEQIFYQTSVLAVDGINANLLDLYGQYERESETIFVDSVVAQKPDEFKNVLTHEYIHALSGRTVLRDAPPEHKDDDVYDEEVDFFHRRVGLGFMTSSLFRSQTKRTESGGAAMRPERRMRWFNEAFTEMLSMSVVGREKGSYLQYRDLLNFMLEKIGPESKGIIASAYFEDYEPEEQTIPGWRKMMQMFNDRFGAGFLVRLDEYVNYHEVNRSEVGLGAKAALEKWRELGDDFPEFLENWFKDNKEEIKKVTHIPRG